MNRILFGKDEISGGLATISGVRADHILDVLHGAAGQILKTGEIDGMVGEGTIVAIEGRTVTLSLRHDRPGLPSWIDIILAPPRPRVAKRLIPQLATMGAGKIVLAGAAKVEKDFWGATMLKPENMRPLLIDALMQAGTSEMPEVIVRKNFKRFLKDELDSMFPDSERYAGHPYAVPLKSASRPGRKLLAIGPEGGWTEDEVSLLGEHGFTFLSLGDRILKTETASIALTSRLMETTQPCK